MKHPQHRKRHELSKTALYKYVFPFAKDNRRAPTTAEEKLWQHLRNRQIDGFKFRRQHVVGRYIADFICIEARLIVEVDGGIHLSPEQQQYDEERSRELQKAGFRILRFWNEEVLDQTLLVLKKISEALGQTSTSNSHEK